MNIQKLQAALQGMRDRIPRGLANCCIVSMSDGQSLVNFNGDPVAEALVTEATRYLQNALSSTPYKSLGSHYIIDLANGYTALIIVMGDYWWGVGFDKKQVSLGMLVNVIVPKAVEDFKAAME